jgi:hypothetical protein
LAFPHPSKIKPMHNGNVTMINVELQLSFCPCDA